MRPLAVLGLLAVAARAPSSRCPLGGVGRLRRAVLPPRQLGRESGRDARVLRALSGGLFTSYGRLYMMFRGGAFQYGSTGLVLESTSGTRR